MWVSRLKGYVAAVLVLAIAVGVYEWDASRLSGGLPSIRRLGVLGISLLAAVLVPAIEEAMLAWVSRHFGGSVQRDRARRALASQPSVRAIADVLLLHSLKASGASAAFIYLGDSGEPFAASSGSFGRLPSAVMPLGVGVWEVGRIEFYGRVKRDGQPLTWILHYGALAIRNALLAEQAAKAELVKAFSQSQRDLRHRLLWSVSSQIGRLLSETQERIGTLRSHLAESPETRLSEDMEAIATRLIQMERLLQENLRAVEGLPSGEIGDPVLG